MTDAPDPPDKDSRPERGINRTARDLDRALAILAATGGIRAFVMQQAREESWTRAVVNAPRGSKANEVRPEPFALNVDGIAVAAGAARSSVYKAIRWLLRANVLVVGADGLMVINTQYTTWVKPGEKPGVVMGPLLTPGQVEWCRQAADVRTFRGPTHQRKLVYSSGQTSLLQWTGQSTPVDKLSTSVDKKSTPVDKRTNRNAGAIAESRDAEKNTQRAGVCGSVQSQEPEAIGIDDPRHAANADDRTPGKEFTHDGPMMPANFGELTRKALELFRGRRTSFPGLLAGMRSDAVWIDLFREIPADIWHDALRDLAATKDGVKWTPTYYLAIVRRMWRDAKEQRRAAEHNAKPARKETPIPPYRETIDPGYLARREKALRLRQIKLGWIKPTEEEAAALGVSA